MVEEFATENLMLTASNIEVDTTAEGFEQRVNNRRGKWGDLWYSE